MKKSEKHGTGAVLKFSEHQRKRVDELETELDALFRLPLTDFTGERNALSAGLKKSGRGDEAARVKALSKPPVSAWAVNQLYWNHRETFDALLASGERFHKMQKSGKGADMRAALDARREALADLSDLASQLLLEAGHNPSLDILRRITSTLEAMSVYASRADAPRPGRLTHDVDPPGFESLASWIPTATAKEAGGRRQAAGTPKFSSAPSNTGAKVGKADAKLQREETRKAQVAQAKASLQDAKRSLAQARARAERLEAAQKKADAEAKNAEKQRREAEQSLEKATAFSEDAARRARKVAIELEEAASAVDDAERAFAGASKELEGFSD
jgi:hypothetical protein